MTNSTYSAILSKVLDIEFTQPWFNMHDLQDKVEVHHIIVEYPIIYRNDVEKKWQKRVCVFCAYVIMLY